MPDFTRGYGIWKDFHDANVIEQLQKPTLVIAHDKTLAAQLYGEFKEMFPDNRSVAYGYFQVSILDKEYVEIQAAPKVVLAQPDGEVFINYMKSRGFTEIEDEQIGAIRVFTNYEEKKYVWYSINGHYSKWRWQ